MRSASNLVFFELGVMLDTSDWQRLQGWITCWRKYTVQEEGG